MVNLKAFGAKHLVLAQQKGWTAAARLAATESALWTASKVADLTNPGTSIWSRDWDICLVLDATRADLWKNHPKVQWAGSNDTIWSVGSSSPGWYGSTFSPREVPSDERVAVVTANPYAGESSGRMSWLKDATPLSENPAVEVYRPVFEESWGTEFEGEYLDVADPDAVTNEAYRTWNSEDPDRMVVHYMQPHIPFRSRPEWFTAHHNLNAVGGPGGRQSEGRDLWLRLRDGDVDEREVWAAYRDNLTWVLDSIRRLSGAVEADVVITSDHGNGMGEWGVWGHPPGIHTPQVRRVPWVRSRWTGSASFSYKSPPAVAEGSPGVQERLEALGYR